MPQSTGLLSGTRLGPYEIVAPIGAGGMGEVYRARDARLGRDVAIKVLPTTMTTDPERLRRFELEARAAAALNHPGILAVFDIGTEGGAPYIVSELLEGETLRARLGRAHQTGDRATQSSDTITGSGAVPVRKAVDYALQIARGLSAAHEKGIVHRDLKPENLFVTTDGRVKILDFGLAKLSEPVASRISDETIVPQTRATDAGTVLGTMGYMSPEQLRAQPVDHRADIFAFGAVLYEMLSGQRAFRGQTPADTISAILDREPPELSSIGPRIPPALARVVDRCLEKSPAARFQSTHDLAFALEGLSSASDTTPPSDVAGLERSTARQSRRDPLAWALAGTFLAALLAMSVWQYQRPAAAGAPVLRFSIDPPTGMALITEADSVAVSPDGHLVAYAAQGASGGSRTIWLRSLDTIGARSLPGTENSNGMFWSPDGQSLGFFAGGKLRRTNVTSGVPSDVCDLPDATGPGASWGAGGEILFDSANGGLWRVPASGGQPMPATTLDAGRQEITHRRPSFLPDGRHFTYVAQPGNHVYVGSLDSADRTSLLDADSPAIYSSGYLLFARQTTLFAQAFDAREFTLSGNAVTIAEQIPVNSVGAGAPFSASANGVLVYETGRAAGSGRFPMQPTWFDRSGKALGSVGDVADYRSLELSADGKRVALHPHENVVGGDILLRDLERNTTSRLTFGGHNTSATWSPDGARLAYSTNLPESGKPSGDPYAPPFNLFVKRADGAVDAVKVLDSAQAGLPAGWKQPTTWSPDGQLVLFDLIDPKTQLDIWALPLNGDRKPHPWLQTQFREAAAQISPDGKWVAYHSDETRRVEVYVRPLSADGKWPISNTGGTYARWRRDGKELFYISGDKKLMAVPIRVNEGLVEAGAPRPLFDMHTAQVFNSGGQSGRSNSPFPYAVSGDGERFLVLMDVSPPVVPQPISVVVNWSQGLKK